MCKLYPGENQKLNLINFPSIYDKSIRPNEATDSIFELIEFQISRIFEAVLWTE